MSEVSWVWYKDFVQCAVLHKKWGFSLKIYSVNVTKSAGNCGFGHIYEEIVNEKLHFLCSARTLITYPMSHVAFKKTYYVSLFNLFE